MGFMFTEDKNYFQRDTSVFKGLCLWSFSSTDHFWVEGGKNAVFVYGSLNANELLLSAPPLQLVHGYFAKN